MAYVVPSVRIFQDLGSTATPTAPDLNAVLVGANKSYLEYTNASDKQKAFAGLYDDLGVGPFAYPSREAGAKVDQKSVKVYFDDVLAHYFTGTDGKIDKNRPNVLESVGDIHFSDYVDSEGNAYTTDLGLHNRGVKIGDQVDITVGPDTFRARVLGLEHKEVAPVIDTPAVPDDYLNHESVLSVDPYEVITTLTVGGGDFATSPIDAIGVYEYIGGGVDTYLVTVLETSGGATPGDTGTPVRFSITNTGGDTPAAQILDVVSGQTHYDIGSRGITFVIDPTDADYVVGDVLTITVTSLPTGQGSVKVTGEYVGTTDIEYTATVVTGGVSGKAEIFVSTAGSVDDYGPVKVVEGQATNIGTKGVQAVFTFPATGKRLVAGDSWTIKAYAGSHTDPVASAGAQVVTVSPASRYVNDRPAYVKVVHFATKQTVTPTVAADVAAEIYVSAAGPANAQTIQIICVDDTDPYDKTNWTININGGGAVALAEDPADGVFLEQATGVYVKFTELSTTVTADQFDATVSKTTAATLDKQWFRTSIYSSDSGSRQFKLEADEDFVPVNNADVTVDLLTGLSLTFTNTTSTLGTYHAFYHLGLVGALQPTVAAVHDDIVDDVEIVEQEAYAAEANWANLTFSQETIPTVVVNVGPGVARTRVLATITAGEVAGPYVFRKNGGNFESNFNGGGFTVITATPTDGVEFSIANGVSVTHNKILLTIASVAGWSNGDQITITPYNYTGVLPTVTGKYRSHLDDAEEYVIDVTSGGALGSAILGVTTTTTDTVVAVMPTIADVTEYPAGDRGLYVALPSTGLTAANADKLRVRITTAAKPMIEVVDTYKFNGSLLYTITVNTAATIASGNLVLDVATPNGVDDGQITVDNGATNGGAGYEVGTRGVKINLLDTPTPNTFTGLTAFYIDTALNSKFVGNKDTDYIMTVTKGGALGTAQVTIVSTAGDASGPTTVVFDVNPYYTGKSMPIKLGGLGILVRFTDRYALLNGLTEDDKFQVHVTSKKLQGKTKIVLSKQAPDPAFYTTGITYKLMMPKNDVEIPKERIDMAGNSYDTDATTIIVNAGLKITDSAMYDLVLGVPVLYQMPVVDGAKMYTTYEALLTGGAYVLNDIADVNDIEAKVGRIDPRNILAYGLFKALQNSNKTVKYMRIDEETEEGFQKALDALQNYDTVYALVPLTNDTVVQQAFASHVEAMSTPDNGRWRIALAQAVLKTVNVLYDFKLNEFTQEPEDYVCTIADDPDAADLVPPQYTKVFDPDATFMQDGIVAGDRLYTNFATVDGVEVYDEYTIDSVVSDQIVLLQTGPTAPIITPTKYKIARPLNKTEQAEYLAATAKAYASRRMYLVWPDFLSDGGEVVAGYFLCAAIAGMVAGFPPHQGFTNIGIVGFDDVSRTTEYFNRTQLNLMAAGGIYIVTQDVPGSIPFARHQLSTDTSSVETQELSITKNLDFLSYYFKEQLKPFIGRWNVTPQALRAIRSVLLGAISIQESNVLPRIGAPLIDATILKLEADALLRDSINIELSVQLPFPINYINLRLIV